MDSILLLAMSTLNTKRNNVDEELKDNTFLYKCGDKEIKVENCKSQLEPIVKYWLKQFPNRDTQIIMLCTDDTLKDENNYYKKTAVEFFKDRIKEYCERENLNNTGQDDFFHEIKLNENEPNLGIQKAVQSIRKYNGSNMQLWIDTHGGFREVTLIMEAIVSLLKVDGIIPARIMGVQFGKIKYIVDQKESFDMFDFVAGMNEFINYGRVNMLQEYYERRGNTGEAEKEILKVMKTVSSGSDECDPEKYTDGLDKLGETVIHIDTTDTLLQIFKDYVIRSYGDLLFKEKRTALGMVKRCLEKKQYLQALTFVESLMPRDLFKHGILYADKEEIQTCREKCKIGKEYDEDEKLLINAYVSNSKINMYYPVKQKSKWRDKCKGKNSEMEMIGFIKKNEVSCTYRFMEDENENRVTNLLLDFNNSLSGVKVSSLVDAKDRDLAGRAMAYHRVLKVCRNKFAHCNPKRAEMEYIVNVMEKYIELIEQLFEKYPSKELFQK